MSFRTIDSREMTRQLLALGVQPGGVLLVHTAFSKTAPVEGGPRAALVRLLVNETVFLHPAGLCGECDEARAGLAIRLS